VRQLELERDGYYAEWQHAKNQLHEIQSSKMWRLWMASIRLRQPWRRPKDSLRAIWSISRRTVSAAGMMLLLLPVLLFKAVVWVGVSLFKALAWVGEKLFRLSAAAWGLSYLLIWTWGAGLMARIRPHSKPAGTEKRPQVTGPTSGARPRVLLVSPYHISPADHGGGVRLLNLVRELKRTCDLYLLVFSQMGEDPEQRAELERHCVRVDYHHWRPRLNPDLLGLVPPNAQLFASDQATAKIRDIVLAHRIDLVQLEYTELGQYRAAVPAGVPVILTEHDIAFRSFRRRRALGFHHRFPEGSAFGTTGADARRLMRYEILSCRTVDQIHTMSTDDADYLARFMPDGTKRMVIAPNGVSTEFYRQPDPPPDRENVLYVGNYQNLPNVDALEYFVLDVWPLLKLDRPDAKLSVVGANPSDRVFRFDGKDGITVVGPVDDLRDAYHGHRVMVAPIRAGSGTRLKILEAFAAGIPVVSTTLAAEGIDTEHERDLLIADDAVAFAKAVARVLDDDELATSMAESAAQLVQKTYDWRLVADTMTEAYTNLLQEKPGNDGVPAADPVISSTGDQPEPEVSVIIPTLNGGEDLARCLEAIQSQNTSRSFEVLCVDSGSVDGDLETMERFGTRIAHIDRCDFNHGLTRDLGAGLARGRILTFLNQDAVPAHENWLDELVRPFDDDDGTLAAVQGGMAEVPDVDARWYWDSCGARFYFTSESKGWIGRYGGIGFSTVNCAIRRSVWDRYPFGWATIMEDKKWQREVTEAGHRIHMQPDALVHHTHVYPLRSLLRRCTSEGYGWRTLGEHYTFADMASDMVDRPTLRDLVGGLRQRRIRSGTELLFPWLRPMALYWGNRFAKDVKL